MFKLELAITEWRRQMLAAGVKRLVPLEELEIHLREEIERLTSAGLGEEEAFCVACQNLGPASALGIEFRKVAAECDAARWKAFAALFAASAVAYPVLVGAMTLFSRQGVFAEITAGQQKWALVAAAVFSLLAWGVRWSYGRYSFLRTRRMRDAIFVPVVLWLVVFAYFLVPHYEGSLSQVGILSLWGFAPFGILVGWLWAMTNAEGKKAFEA